MHTIIVKQIEIRGGNPHVARHLVQIPDVSDHGFYRTILSFNAFFNSIYRRNWSSDHLFSVADDRMETRRLDWEVRRDAELPHHEHASLQDFFIAIGYDRKTKKFKPTTT